MKGLRRASDAATCGAGGLRNQQQLAGRGARLEILVRLARLGERIAGADPDVEPAGRDQLEQRAARSRSSSGVRV